MSLYLKWRKNFLYLFHQKNYFLWEKLQKIVTISSKNEFYDLIYLKSDFLEQYLCNFFNICFLKNLITNATILMLCLSFSFATVLKYLVLAKRTVPEMNEGYVAKLSIFFILLVSCGVSSIKFFIGYTKPTFNQVSKNMKLTKNFTLK